MLSSLHLRGTLDFYLILNGLYCPNKSLPSPLPLSSSATLAPTFSLLSRFFRTTLPTLQPLILPPSNLQYEPPTISTHPRRRVTGKLTPLHVWGKGCGVLLPKDAK